MSALFEDRERTVWAGSVGIPTGRLCAIRAGRATCSEDAAVGGGAAGFYEDRKGNLWAGVPNGLWRWKPGDPEFYSIPDEASGVRVLEDEDGSLLIVGGEESPASSTGGSNHRPCRMECRTISPGGCFMIAMAGCGSRRSTAAWRMHGGRTDRSPKGTVSQGIPFETSSKIVKAISGRP